MRRVGTKRNDNFYFLSFSVFSNLFFPKISISGLVGTDQNENLFFSLSRLFPTHFCLKRSDNVVF